MTAEISPRIDLKNRTKLEAVIPLSTPYLVFLDPSDKCNDKCAWCPTGSGKASRYRRPQIMDWDLYAKIVSDLAAMPEPIKTLRLYMMGEPLLNPNFPDMVKFAKETGRFGQVDTTTNGLKLSPWMNRKIVDSRLDKIFISVPQNYNQNYIENVWYLYDLALGKPRIHVKIIGDGLSEEEKYEFLGDFSPISDSIFIENLAPCWPGFDVGKVGDRGIYGQEVKEVQICPYIFYSLAINSDGKVSLCFLDWKKEMVLGDLKKQSFKKIWNGRLLRDYRIWHLTKNRKFIKNCNVCGQLKYGAPDNIDQYAKKILERIET